jgi:hypothetical protein
MLPESWGFSDSLATLKEENLPEMQVVMYLMLQIISNIYLITYRRALWMHFVIWARLPTDLEDSEVAVYI